MAESQAKLIITAENRTQVAFDAVKRQMDSVSAAAVGLKGALGAIGLTTSFAGISAAFAGIVKYRGELDDLADITGDNVRQLDGLARVAKLSGVSIGDLQPALAKLAKSLGDSGEEGKAAEGAVKAIGLSVNDLRALKPGEAFEAVARALGKYEDGADKVRVAQALLGKEGANLLPVLKDIAEFGDLQGKVTAEQAAQAERLEKEWKRLSGALSASKSEIATQLIPPMADFLEQIREGIRLAGGLRGALDLRGIDLFSGSPLIGGIREIVRLYQGTSGLQDGATNVKAFTEELEKLRATQEKLRGEGNLGQVAALNPAIRDLEKRLALARKRADQDFKAGKGLDVRPGMQDFTDFQEPDVQGRIERSKLTLDFKGAAGKPPGDAADPFADIMKRIAAEKAGLESEKNFYVEIATLLKEDKKLREGLTAEQKKRVLQAAAQVAQEKDLASIREEQKKYEEESARRAAERTRQLGAEADAIRDQLDPTRALFRELERIDLLKKEGFITLEEGREQSRRAVERLTSTVTEQQRLTIAANDSAQAFRDMGYTAASALEDILIKGGSARDILKALGQDLQRILIRQTLTKPLADTAGGFFANLFGKGPNVTTSREFNQALDLQGFATGGSFTVGGAGGTDSQLVAFRATPGEEVSIRTPGQQAANGGTFYIDARGADAGGLARLEQTIRNLNGSIERRAVAAVFNANVRGVRV